MRVHRLGDHALLVEVDDPAGLYRSALERRVPATEIVPAAGTVLFDGLADPDRLAADLPTWELGPAKTDAEPEVVEVPTHYDGADLDDVARLWGMTTAEVVRTHVSIEFEVAFCGFAPGFPYCTGMPEHLHVPRLDSPRPRVPAGSVGLAGGFTGIYPSASPGGWRLLGRTELVLWDHDRDRPATLPPGTRVRFVAL